MPRWLLPSLAAIATFGVWGILYALASSSLPPLAVQVLSTCGLLPFALVLLFSPRLMAGKPFGRGAGAALLAGLCGSAGNICVAASIGLGADASLVFPLTGMYPLVTVLLAVPLLGERLHRIQAAGLGLAAIAFVLFGLQGSSPGEESRAGVLTVAGLLAIASLVAFGLVGFLQKIAVKEVSSELSTVLFTGGFLAVGACILPWARLEWPLAAASLWAIASGVLLGAGTLVLFAAYRHGKASVITPLTALYPAVTAVLAVPLLGEEPTWTRAAAIVTSLLAAAALSREADPAVPADQAEASSRQAGSG